MSKKGGSHRGGKSHDHASKSTKDDYYESYYNSYEIEEGMKKGHIISGFIRVVSKFDGKAFINNDNYTIDICIDGDKYRNRALDGDLVAVELFPQDQWNVLDVEDANEKKKILATFDPSNLKKSLDKKSTYEEDISSLKVLDRKEGTKKDSLWGSVLEIENNSFIDVAKLNKKEIKVQPMGKVVSVLKVHHKVDYIGLLTVPSNVKHGQPVPSSISYTMFKPYDNKCPFIKCPFGVLPPEFLADPHKHSNTLYSVNINSWSERERSPEGIVRQSVGEAGEIATETQVLLIEFDVNHGDFPEEVLNDLKDYGDDWEIPIEEISKRRDLRHVRVFSIDPSTARDLDDALHVTPLENGEFEIGVHIADVSYFIPQGSNLDKEAQRRSTTVYLVQMIVPMLPRILCEKLCSLNPGVDRLAFSVIFRMRKDGNLSSEEPWFGRTIIHSCSKLDYDTAQRMISGEIKLTDDEISFDLWEEKRRPVKPHTLSQVIQDVLNLQMIAKERRKRRFENGALQLNRPKLCFARDDDGNPIEVFTYPIKDSNSLIEEFMLLGNYLVAEKLILQAKSKAFLRHHPPPKLDKIGNLIKAAEDCNIKLDISSAGELQKSLKMLPNEQKKMWEWLTVTCMNQAQYFVCASSPPTAWRHYALSIPYYTHFTSPIRRYADVIVHRLLNEVLTSMNAEESFPDSFDHLNFIAQHCNEKKTASRKAQERSDFIYLCVYLKDHPVITNATVLEVSYARFKILIPDFSYEHMILVYDFCKEEEAIFDKETCTLNLPTTIFNPNDKSGASININVFDQFQVNVTADLSKRPTIVVKLLKKM